MSSNRNTAMFATSEPVIFVAARPGAHITLHGTRRCPGALGAELSVVINPPSLGEVLLLVARQEKVPVALIGICQCAELVELDPTAKYCVESTEYQK